MYNAYITEVKELRKHSNADRLQVATFFGSDTIVGLDVKIGDRGVFFPSDGQLGVEYATKNNLVRKKDDDGNNIGGYLDPDKRNITTIKLRGEKSDGLFMPLESLAEFTDISTLKNGDIINVLNGVVICQKYIPRTNKRKNSNPSPKGKKKVIKETFPMFAEHADTEQLAYNLDAFKEGDICYITLKMHGCFVSGTKVKMADGSSKKINNIKKGDEVLAYDFNDKKFKSAKVLTAFKNPKSNRWNKIKVSRYGFNGEQFRTVTSTYNHPFYKYDTNEWIKACDLKEGDTIGMLKESYILTRQQKEVLAGLILGDGSVCENKNTSSVENSIKFENMEYLEYIKLLLGDIYSYNINNKRVSGYGSCIVRGRTKYLADIFNFLDEIYVKRTADIKQSKLKENIIKYFSPLSMAVLYMDDGSLCHNENQKDRANIAICDYNDEDALIIQKCFNKFDIYPVIYKTENYNRLRFNTEDAYKMFDLIRKYVPKIMQYKLPSEYRDKYYIQPIDPEPVIKSYVFTKQKIISNEPLNNSFTEYDLETSLHNYIVGDMVVHNTSQRTAYTIKEKRKILPNWVQKVLHFFKIKPKNKKSWEYVTGTRRCTLTNFNKETGFYGSDAFRKPYHDFFIGKLNKGEEIFYEVLGYVNENTLIMGEADNNKTKDKDFIKQYGPITKFIYGCQPNQNIIRVYRMTITNEDGHTVEYPTELCKKRCEEMGVEFVPVFEKFVFTTKEDLMERVEKYYDGADPVGLNHIREGVVVRIDNAPKFRAYKHKNFWFKVLSGIAVENLEKEGKLDGVSDDILSEL